MELKVTARSQSWKRNKLLRKEGLVPGVIYGKHLSTSVNIEFTKNEFLSLYKKAWSSTVIDLTGDSKEMVLIHDFQLNGVTNNLLHVDFLAVRADVEVAAEVPVVLTGESPLAKSNEGRIELVKDHIAVVALPRELPGEIVIDISKIATLEDGIFVRDLDLGAKVRIDEDMDLPVVVAVEIQAEEVEVKAVATTDATATAEPAKTDAK